MRYRSINDSSYSIAVQLNGYYIATVIIVNKCKQLSNLKRRFKITSHNWNSKKIKKMMLFWQHIVVKSMCCEVISPFWYLPFELHDVFERCFKLLSIFTVIFGVFTPPRMAELCDLSFILSVSRITRERVSGVRPNMAGTDKWWSSRSNLILVLLRIRMWI